MGEVGEGTPEGGYDRGARVRRNLGSPHSNGEPGKVAEEGRSAPGSPGGPLGQCRGFNHILLSAGPSHPACVPSAPREVTAAARAPQGVSSCKSLQSGPLCLRGQRLSWK